jgi:glycerol-3-phosphate O-acyltransferase
MSWVLWRRGYSVPLVAAGANLSFFPLGWIFRRGGAFFLRRSFKDDLVYTSAFKAYIKKLVREGMMQEFFPEGGRSRTGKLMRAKMGMLSWEIDAIRDEARDDLVFIPVSIDYERVVESASFSRELTGGEKKPENLRGLLSARKVLRSNYGRIHLAFDEPIGLTEFSQKRHLDLTQLDDTSKKRLVRALGHRIIYGIGRVSTITPHALLSAVLLAHRRRGIGAREIGNRIRFLRDLAEREGARLSSTLNNAPSDPSILGPIQDAMRGFSADGFVKVEEVKDESIYRAVDEHRLQLSFYKNTLMNLFAPLSLVANALLLREPTASLEATHEAALFLSRLFKFEFIYRVDATFDVIFKDTIDRLSQAGLVVLNGASITIPPESHVRPNLEFLAELLRDFIESYYLAALAMSELAKSGPIERKTFVRNALETGRAEFLSGRIGASESLSRSNIENAVAYFVDQNFIFEENNRLRLNADASSDSFVKRIREYLSG